jgi:cytochrome c-type biogenesis protein CcmH/NrfG
MIDSKNVKAMKILALSYTKMDNNNKACDVYRKMLELNPRDVEAQEGLQKTCN